MSATSRIMTRRPCSITGCELPVVVAAPLDQVPDPGIADRGFLHPPRRRALTIAALYPLPRTPHASGAPTSTPRSTNVSRAAGAGESVARPRTTGRERRELIDEGRASEALPFGKPLDALLARHRRGRRRPRLRGRGGFSARGHRRERGTSADEQVRPRPSRRRAHGDHLESSGPAMPWWTGWRRRRPARVSRRLNPCSRVERVLRGPQGEPDRRARAARKPRAGH